MPRLLTLAFACINVATAIKKKKDGDDTNCNPDETCCNNNQPAFSWENFGAGCGLWLLMFLIGYLLLVKLPKASESVLWRSAFCRREAPESGMNSAYVYPLGNICAGACLVVAATIHGSLFGTYFFEQNVIVGGAWSDLVMLVMAVLFILRAVTRLPAQGWFDFVFESTLILAAGTVVAAAMIDLTFSGWVLGHGADAGLPATLQANSWKIHPLPLPVNVTAAPTPAAADATDCGSDCPGLGVLCKSDITGCSSGNTNGVCTSCLVYEIAAGNGQCEGGDAYQGICFAVPDTLCGQAKPLLAQWLLCSCAWHVAMFFLLMLNTALWHIEQDIYHRKKPALCGDGLGLNRGIEIQDSEPQKPLASRTTTMQEF